ncbi:MAG: VPDSG-CTERM sorting domain-containing protein, partial [Opitutaceae bacterium]
TTINLGTVRTGTVVNSTTVPALGLSIQNVAPTTGGYTENLGASFGAVSSGLAGSGSPINGLAVGNTSNAMALTFTAGAAGTYNGSAVVNFQTQAINASGLANAGIGSQTVDVDAIVNALADGVVQQNGGTYSFSGGANSGTLNFGAITQGSGTVGDALELLNDVTGDADMLTGGYSPALVGPFSYTPGNGATFTLGDMQASDFDISFNTDYSPTGFFSETLTIDENSYNAAQGAMVLTPYDLTIEGTINPVGVSNGVPDSSATWLLLGLGLASLVLVRRRAVI